MDCQENYFQEPIEPIRITTDVIAGPNRQIIARVRGHEVIMDVRKERGGDDAAPTPPEYLAMALGGCMLNLIRIIAAEKKVRLGEIRATITGAVDPSRAMGRRSENRAGFLALDANLFIESDLPAADQAVFKQQVLERCVLCDTLENATELNCSISFQA
jgi:putative redox protein